MKSNTHLTFNTHQIPEFGLELADTLPASVLDLADDDLLQPADEVTYDLTARIIGLDLLVDGYVRTALAAHCDRCDVQFNLPLVVEKLYYFQEAPLPDFVDLTDVVREELLLQIPTKILCSTDCELPSAPEAPPPEVIQSSPWGDLDKLDLNS